MIFFVSMVLRKIFWHGNGEYIILGQAVFLKLAKILLKILLLFLFCLVRRNKFINIEQNICYYFILKLKELILTVSGSTYYSVLLAPKRSKKSDVTGGKTEEKTKSDQKSQLTKKLR